MSWQVIVALVIAIPVILLPVVLVLYLNMGGIYAAIKAAQRRQIVNRQVNAKRASEAN